MSLLNILNVPQKHRKIDITKAWCNKIYIYDTKKISIVRKKNQRERANHVEIIEFSFVFEASKLREI